VGELLRFALSARNKYMKKKIYIALVLLILLLAIVFYFSPYAPIYGWRQPSSYADCIKVDGVTFSMKEPNSQNESQMCVYRNIGYYKH
jgi:hypothetical protein